VLLVRLLLVRPLPGISRSFYVADGYSEQRILPLHRRLSSLWHSFHNRFTCWCHEWRRSVRPVPI